MISAPQIVQHHGADCAGQKARQVKDAGVGEGFHGASVARVGRSWQYICKHVTIRRLTREIAAF